jgi:hypothetical protein
MKQRQKTRKGKQNTEVRPDNFAVVLTYRKNERTLRAKKTNFFISNRKRQNERIKYIGNEFKSKNTRM